MRAEVREQRKTRYGTGWVLVAALLFTVQVRAQLTVGDNLKMNMNGNLGYGYSGTAGDTGNSHSENFVGNGTLTGSYYNPTFLSFSVRPYWDRNQNNSLSQLITHDKGVDSSVSLFSGSSFPGSISYGKSFSSTGQFGMPGIVGVETNGSGQTFGISWNEVLPDLPPVYANFSITDSNYTALGSSGENRNANKNFNMGSTYSLLGFSLSGNFNHGVSNYKYSDLLGLNNSGDTASTSFSFGAQHRLPFRGSGGVSFGHSKYTNESTGETSGGMNNLSATSTLMPWSRVSISGQAQYTTNLSAAISQSLLSDGSTTMIYSDTRSHAFSVSSGVSVNIGHGLTANGYASRMSVSYVGRKLATAQYGGTLTYNVTHSWLGLLRFSGGIVDTANKQGNGGMAAVGNVGMNHRFGHWDTSADFSYSQDVRTLYGIATTSNFTYGGSVRRRFNENTYWNGSFRASHTAITGQSGTGSGSESLSSGISWRRYSFGGSYSTSNGTSVITSTGLLTPTPAAGLITNDFLLYNGHSVSASASTRLFRKMSVSGVYATARSEMQTPTALTFSDTKIYTARLEYRLRKMSLYGGFSRTNQDASSSTSGPIVVNSFYLSFSRWFNVF